MLLIMEFKSTITREEIVALPGAAYEGRVVVVESDDEIDQALAPMLGAKVVGFDTETRPAFRKGVSYPVSLLQLGVEDYVVLFRLNKIGLSEKLTSFLSNPDIIKVGVGIRDDISALQRLKKFNPQSFVDLQSVVADYGIADKSFAKLMAIIFGVHVSKRQRVSDWSVNKLSEAQIRYAATDAWGAAIMYNKLLSGK